MFNKQPNNQRIVMAFGTFDLLHEGHEHFLKQAKSRGEHLMVIIARDRTVKQVKGELPANNEKKRLKNLKQTGLVDKIILGDHYDKYHAIKKFRPAVIALGYDQMVFTQKLNKLLIDLNLDTEIIRMDAFFPQIYKSSLLKRQHPEGSEKTAPFIQPIPQPIPRSINS